MHDMRIRRLGDPDVDHLSAGGVDAQALGVSRTGSR
jgi:hypothetical protein